MKAVDYETITLIGDFRPCRNEIHVYIRRSGTSFFDNYGKRGMN